MKVGTGFQHTVKGRIYILRKQWRTGERGSLAFIGGRDGGRLYYRAANLPNNASLLVIRPSDLQREGEIMQDGRGSVCYALVRYLGLRSL